jgi:hypothetical protein
MKFFFKDHCPFLFCKVIALYDFNSFAKLVREDMSQGISANARVFTKY